MAIEIERKFLVQGDYKSQAHKAIKISQGYLSSVPERSVRIRIKGEQGFITIKGIALKNGMSRYEWEKEIDAEEANELISLCEPVVIIKTRYLVYYKDHLFEIDEFHGENKGLTVAEIELSSEDEYFERPEWLAEEVTGDEKYYNSMLSKNPYSGW